MEGHTTAGATGSTNVVDYGSNHSLSMDDDVPLIAVGSFDPTTRINTCPQTQLSNVIVRESRPSTQPALPSRCGKGDVAPARLQRRDG
jgi:hypothetical protein